MAHAAHPQPGTPAPLRFSVLSLAIGALMASTAAGAQTAAPADTPPPGALRQITVTGQVESETATSPVYGMVAKRTSTGVKTDTDLLETPQSVSVVTREQIELQGAKGIDEAVRYTSGTVGGAFGQDPRSDCILVRGFKPV